MAGSGIKATTQLSNSSITNYGTNPVYTVPSNYYGVYNISFTNTTSSTVQIRLVMGASTVGSINTSEIFEYQTNIVPYGVFERTGVVLSAGTNIIASTNTAGVNVNVYGIETSTS
jgi:hypothetical protein